MQCDDCERKAGHIGSEDATVRVLAFGAGGFDTVVQMGVAHALIVSEAATPDVLVGISAGAVNAAAVRLRSRRRSGPATG